MRVQPPTRFDLSPSNLEACALAPCQTPSRRRGRDSEDENINPVLFSPSKRMRTLYAHLGQTSTSSLLLSALKIKSYDTAIVAPVVQHVPHSIPTPNWSLLTTEPSEGSYKTRGQLEMEIADLRKQLLLAHRNVTVQDQILEEANATMVLQNMGLKKMNEALHQQDEKAATDHAKLFKGKAQCLSLDEFHEAVKEIEEGRKAREAGKEAKKVARQRRKELKEEVEREWAAMKEHHATEVKAWSEECSRLLGVGAQKKDLPPKPKLGKKPAIPVVDEEEDELEDEPMDDGDV
ncbi:hypothetical protein DFH07DRAFT_752048 [Mycena maculata]|uniref:Uncharacterized protein n=1 Tax=Mycena maculata TaxID=230809 RepID=A0AAD7N155_9AGAR|nr:hypothetical protein DFH07DRAFT_752048 [Mycena maculata]